jgi:hypothetical protein
LTVSNVIPLPLSYALLPRGAWLVSDTYHGSIDRGSDVGSSCS